MRETEIVRQALEIFYLFHNGGMLFALFLAGLLYLGTADREKQWGRLLSSYTIIIGFLYLCPLSAFIIMKYCVGELVYWRMFWLLPTAIVIAYAAVRCQDITHKKWLKFSIFCAALLVIAASGRNVYTQENFKPAENEYKLAQPVIEVCDLINRDAVKHGLEEKKITAPNDLICYVRQYDAGIKLLYGRSAIRGNKMNAYKTYIYKAMTEGISDWKKLARCLKKENCLYFVCHTNIEDKSEIENYGYEWIGEMSGYTVYRMTL